MQSAMDFMSLVVTLFFGYIIIYLFAISGFWRGHKQAAKGFSLQSNVGRGNKVLRGLFFVVYCTSLLHKFIESLLLQSKTKSKYEVQFHT
jgi:hypothetical protein